MTSIFKFLFVFTSSFIFICEGVAEISPVTVKNEISEPVTQCAELVKECYVSSNTEQANCLFSAAKHPFCEGSSLGKLVYKRWIMSPIRGAGPDSSTNETLAFLGPKLINQDCIKNFDNKMLAKLILPENAWNDKNGTIKSLDKELSQCTQELSEHLTRP